MSDATLGASHDDPHDEFRGTRPVVTQFLARHLWSSPRCASLADAVRRQRQSYDRAGMLVRVFYAVSVLWAVQAISTWARFTTLENVDPLWPAAWWFDQVSVGVGAGIVFGGFLVASLVVALVPDQRLARVVYAIMVLQYIAVVNSPFKINHNFHMWFFVSMVLVLLPKGKLASSRRTGDRQYFLTVVWVAILLPLFFYSLTGLWKIVAVIDALNEGTVSALDRGAFAFIVANRLLQDNQPTVLGDFFVRNETIGWALFLGTIGLEAFSILIAFRPRLHRLWGLGLILFHVGTQLAMGFTFGQSIVVLALFLVCSPFAPDRFEIRETFWDLPVLFFLRRRLQRMRDRQARRRERSPVVAQPTRG